MEPNVLQHLDLGIQVKDLVCAAKPLSVDKLQRSAGGQQVMLAHLPHWTCPGAVKVLVEGRIAGLLVGPRWTTKANFKKPADVCSFIFSSGSA